MKPAAFIFDMDGLLIDSEPLWRKAQVDVLRSVGVPMTEEMCLKTTGIRIDEIVSYWFKKYPWKRKSKRTITNNIVDKVIEAVKKDGVAKPGVHHAMSLAKELGCKIAIATSSSHRLIKVVIKELKIEKFLDFYHSAEKEKHGKPNPAVYLTTAKKLRIKPEQCVAFEDSPNGVLAAKSAKMKCVAVPESLARGEKEFAVSDIVLNSLNEISTEIINAL